MRFAILVLLACLGACDVAAEADAAAPAGALVESRAPRWGQADAWRLDPAPEATIGTADGAPEYALANVVGAARLSSGRIVIANFTTLDLRYYDAWGRHVRTVGRKGNGPGEFRLVRGIGVVRDTVLVWDPFANRVSRFDGTGTFAGSTSIDISELVLPNLIGFLGDGSLLIRHDPNGERENREGENASSVVYLRFSSETGARISTLGPYFGSEVFTARAGRNWMSDHVIFGRRSFVASTRTGFHRAVSDRFEATFFAADGAPLRTIRRPYTPVRATAADVGAKRDAMEETGEEILRMDSDMATAQRRLMETIPHRSTLPAISQIRVDREDNLWMQAYVPPDADAAEWSVFDPEGHWLGVVEIPTGLEVLEIGDDYVLAKTVDPLNDVERVVLYRLRKPH